MNATMIDTLEAPLGAWPPSADWWRGGFDLVTRGGVEPYLMKGVLPPHFPGSDEVGRALTRIQQSGAPERAKLRVYVGETRRDDLADSLVASSPTGDEFLYDYVLRHTGRERFSLVINSLQDWSPELTEAVGEFLQSMFNARGMPLGGCEQVAFVGDYAGTAFGVHRGFEHAFLIHLGPGKKDFHCWSEDTYRTLTGSLEPTFGDYDWLLSRSQLFVLEPGDVLYLPALVYHVGRQDSFSVSVACPLYTYPLSRILRELVGSLAQTLPFDELGMSPHQPFECNRNPLLSALVPFARRTFADWTSNNLPQALDDYWYGLVSNGGFDLTHDPVGEDGNEVRLRPALPFSPMAILRVQPPYRLCWTTDRCPSNALKVFLRGASVLVDRAADLPKLLGRLNDGEEILLQSCTVAQAAALTEIARTGGLQLNAGFARAPTVA